LEISTIRLHLPAAGFAGSGSFIFAPSDGLVEGAVHTVSLTITNPPPTAGNATYLYVPGLPLSISATGVVVS
jgi:hypothetical protein